MRPLSIKQLQGQNKRNDYSEIYLQKDNKKTSENSAEHPRFKKDLLEIYNHYCIVCIRYSTIMKIQGIKVGIGNYPKAPPNSGALQFVY
jgi:hypothetical protein